MARFPRGHFHVPDLAFPVIDESAVREFLVGIAKVGSLVTTKDQNERIGGGSCDAAVLLATVDAMNLTLSVIDPTKLKRRS